MMLGTSHTSQPTHTSYDNEETNKSKMSKKTTLDNYKPNAYMADPFEAV